MKGLNPLNRIVQFSPNIFTLLNLSSGVIALVFIVNHCPKFATIFTIASVVFDYLALFLSLLMISKIRIKKLKIR